MNVTVTLTDPTDSTKTATVSSHPTDAALVVLDVGGQSINLNADELVKAQRNAINVPARKPAPAKPASPPANPA